MDFRDMVLDPVSFDKLSDLRKYWLGERYSNRANVLPVRITTPIKESDYKTLFRKFSESEFADAISVPIPNRRKWMRRFRRELKDGEIEKLVEIAYAERDLLTDAELYLRENNNTWGKPEGYHRVSFTRVKGGVVAFHVRFGRLVQDRFSWLSRPQFNGYAVAWGFLDLNATQVL